MADGPLHPGGGGIEPLGYLRIEHLGHRVDDIHIGHCDQNGFPQILIALDMGRHPHLVNDGGDSIFQIIGDISIFFLFIFAGQLPDALTHRAHPAGLGHIVVRSLGGGQLGHASLGKTGQDQHLGPMLQLCQLLQHLDAVHLGQHDLHDYQVRSHLLYHLDQFLPVSRLSQNLDVRLAGHGLDKAPAKFFPGIGDQNPFCTHFHNQIPSDRLPHLPLFFPYGVSTGHQ